MGEVSPQSRLQAGDRRASERLDSWKEIAAILLHCSTRRRDQPDNLGSGNSRKWSGTPTECASTQTVRLSNYRLDGFSVERLMNFLIALDRDVDIIIRRLPRSRKVVASW
jgi:hypothetical protein